MGSEGLFNLEKAMPICFNLTRIGATAPEKLSKIDEELCAILDEEVHPTRYVMSWFDMIGFELACGKKWDEIRTKITTWFDTEKAKNEFEVMVFESILDSWLIIFDYLKNNFIPSGWRD
jgi:hypothetical protein